MTTAFATRICDWHARHGRHDLPWQHPRTPYRVWVSEIMLQQTTVATVIGYFDRFMQRFPDVQTLAAADRDSVMSHWQGLGYYARARNLHACAQRVVADFAGAFPADRATLETLPGIGRSTAAAICAQAFGQREAILDANVRRVLCRHSGIAEWPGLARVQKTLWRTAEAHLPDTDMANYTQGLMDLGARVCKARQPQCHTCPVHTDCIARRDGLIDRIPAPNPRKRAARPQRHCQMWIHRRSDGAIWLQRRPPAGIWGGLWSLPQSAPQNSALPPGDLPSYRHVFSHFDLTIHPVLGPPPPSCAGTPIEEGEDGRWVRPDELTAHGLPTAVHRILATLTHE